MLKKTLAVLLTILVATTCVIGQAKAISYSGEAAKLVACQKCNEKDPSTNVWCHVCLDPDPDTSGGVPDYPGGDWGVGGW